MTANVARRKKVPFAEFVKGYKAGCDAGKTAEEIAESLNMETASMTSRASQIRQQAAEIGRVFPSPAGGGSSKAENQKAKVDLLTSLLGELETDETADNSDSVDSDESVE